MRHVLIRGIMGLIWLAAAIISGVSGNLEMSSLYVILGGVFLYSSCTTWKKDYKGGSSTRQKEPRIPPTNLSSRWTEPLSSEKIPFKTESASSLFMSSMHIKPHRNISPAMPEWRRIVRIF